MVRKVPRDLSGPRVPPAPLALQGRPQQAWSMQPSSSMPISRIALQASEVGDQVRGVGEVARAIGYILSDRVVILRRNAETPRAGGRAGGTCAYCVPRPRSDHGGSGRSEGEQTEAWRASSTRASACPSSPVPTIRHGSHAAPRTRALRRIGQDMEHHFIWRSRRQVCGQVK